jgi:beta-lactam-binding protein with PASTA domain
VPKVVGLRLAVAKTRVRRARCSVGRVRSARSSARRAGKVLRQSPSPGTRLPLRSRVNLVVGRR